MTNPLISVVVCCYNRATLLRETMASIFAQQYEPVEIIVVDDGSLDETPELIASYGDRVRYHRQPNSGIAVARTQGCCLAKGEYIAFQDDDDLMPPDRLVALYAALKQFPRAVMAVGDFAVIDAAGQRTGHRWLPASDADETVAVLVENAHVGVLWPTLPAAPHTTLFRRADGEKIGWFDQTFRYAAEDKDFFARLARLGPVAYVPKVVSLYRRGHGSLTQNSLRTEYAALQLYGKHLGLLDSSDSRLADRLRFRMCVALGNMASLCAEGFVLPQHIPADYLQEWLPMLNAGGKVRFWWRAHVRIPLRRLVQRLFKSRAKEMASG